MKDDSLGQSMIFVCFKPKFQPSWKIKENNTAWIQGLLNLKIKKRDEGAEYYVKFLFRV